MGGFDIIGERPEIDRLIFGGAALLALLLHF
jgi:hypothetical protein